MTQYPPVFAVAPEVAGQFQDQIRELMLIEAPGGKLPYSTQAKHDGISPEQRAEINRRRRVIREVIAESGPMFFADIIARLPRIPPQCVKNDLFAMGSQKKIVCIGRRWQVMK